MGYVPHPTAIEYESATNRLKMVFSDDHVSVYPTAYLRGYCPCARCQGHSAGPPKFQEITTSAQIEVDDIHQVGSYALAICWADGHDTGIYSWRLLRDMCPCPECMPDGLPEEVQAVDVG